MLPYFVHTLRFLCIVCFILWLPIGGMAQVKTTLTDTTTKVKVSNEPLLPIKKEKFQPIPKKSGFYSAIVPGLGQVYNRQYWKVPVIYAGIAVTGYFLFFNIDEYQKYRKAYIGRISNDPNFHDAYEGIYTTDNLKQLQDGYKRYIDITVLFTALGYAIQVMDAITFAHLKNFDVSTDISMHLQAVPVPGGAGLGLVVNF